MEPVKESATGRQKWVGGGERTGMWNEEARPR